LLYPSRPQPTLARSSFPRANFRECGFPTFMCVVQAHILDDAHGG
jgi:hypothetical protein